ncbi:hypothetical protein [Gottfriedia solisilvae]|uniref:hypothetical protein n=1 Tax=Gottfriedia solisilvae TaxID=1516104 RepID=UPI003D2F211D
MANCDWGRPCDCKDCRTTNFEIQCPHCSFQNSVSYERTSLGIETDRKGIQYYEFQEQTEPVQTLDCYKCNNTIHNVPYYEKLDEDRCKYKLELENAATCEKCGVKEEKHLWTTKNIKVNERNLCIRCAEPEVKSKTLDPSDSNNKYIWDYRKLEFQLDKVKVKCIKCGKARFMNPENAWKTTCLPCYKRNKNY